jgi:catechol 2,3-dioxygenase-like lactoylglutathione lyase family enzyme
MAFNHVALATRDLDATHAFYTEVMGFSLVKVVVAPTDNPGGWAKHVFYDTGGNGLMAFWDIHDAGIGTDFPVDLSRSHGLPVWINHLAFDAPSLDVLEAHKERWRRHGHTVTEIDHGWCRSIYIVDPNHIMVEFCCITRPFSAEELADAPRLLREPAPPLDTPPAMRIHAPSTAASRA